MTTNPNPAAKPKVALITGVTGQDGSYLAELLLNKGYVVHGIKRRSSQFNTQRVDHIYQDPHIDDARFHLHYGDLSDTSNLIRIVQETQPDEVYNLGAQSHVAVSFESPEYTADVDGMGTLRLLEAIRILGLEKKTRFYQASTSELYGLVQEIPQKETTPFYPRSPYAVAKMYAYWITVNYREAYGMYACNGILFNHESPRRGETFVTRKITRGLANIAQGLESCLYMGNLDSLRDWGHAKDYVRMQWMMLQQEQPEDFVIATGVQYSVRQFIDMAAQELGVTLRFEGEGVLEPTARVLNSSRWFIGHESAHFWLGQVVRYERARDAWITEGGADLMAIRALKALDPTYDAREALQKEVDDCIALSTGRSVETAETRGEHRAYYACGAVFAMAAEGVTGGDWFAFLKPLLDASADDKFKVKTEWQRRHDQVKAAGGRFAVSPGATDRLKSSSAATSGRVG